MSIRVEFGGVSYFCETPEEAVALGRLLMPAPTNARPRALEPAAAANGHQPSITALVQSLREGPRRLLQIVVDAGGEIEQGELFQTFGGTSSAFGGFLAAITKEANRQEVDPRTLLHRVVRTTPTGEVIRFRIPPGALDQVRAGLNTQVEGR